MKTAQTSDGNLIPASAEAPKEAICPHCKGTVVLRNRRLMSSEKVTYYWRHRSNKNRDCSSRKRLV